MPPCIKNRTRCRFIELWAAFAIRLRTVLDCRASDSVHGPCAFYVVEERIVAQAGEYSKPSVLAFETRSLIGVATDIVSITHPALDGTPSIKTTDNQRGCCRLAEFSSAIYVEHVL